MAEIREIPKNPQSPDLNEEVIKLLTKLCFRKNDEIDKVDMLFVLGNTDFVQTSRIVRDLLNKNVSKTVLISGCMPQYEDSRILDKSEAEIILDYIRPHEFPNIEFFLEKNSNNVAENIKNGIKLIDKIINSLYFINRSQGAGRCYLSIRKYLPHIKIYQQVFESDYDGKKVGADNWFKTEFGRGRVWGEFLRIKKYGQEGLIEFNEVANLVK